MDASKLLNPERRMLKLMQSDSSKKWSLEEVLSSCNWSDQAVAVGAGLGPVSYTHLTLPTILRV